jgi:hypothetical protein
VRLFSKKAAVSSKVELTPESKLLQNQQEEDISVEKGYVSLDTEINTSFYLIR